jgi:hypothetical protein
MRCIGVAIASISSGGMLRKVDDSDMVVESDRLDYEAYRLCGCFSRLAIKSDTPVNSRRRSFHFCPSLLLYSKDSLAAWPVGIVYEYLRGRF